ncbi:hypothetical protein WR25_21151 [Diploscapter pachys]|uniref:protein-tyrosine-phosphatase n=1 Tax=Diploscapter pachys TaxID=2018661 RepID=A0A2A2L9N6_9BILA|nr:hypothetical protein WR25_21151 [Diploscapter pachys]
MTASLWDFYPVDRQGLADKGEPAQRGLRLRQDRKNEPTKLKPQDNQGRHDDMSYRPCNFFYNVTGEEAERLLKEYGVDGEFLARPSESHPRNFTLSIVRGESVTHIKIHNKDDMLNLCGGESFPSLSDLVQFYMENPDQLQEKNGGTIVLRRPVSIPLSEPAAKEVREPTAQRWFHANITGAEAVQLLSKEKQWAFLVRESQRQPGYYAITVKTDENVVHILIRRNSATGMYHVGGGDEFRSVSDLLEHYNNNPMVEENSQRVVHLINLVPSTCVPADAIEARISLLQHLDPNTNKTGLAEEFEKVPTNESYLSKREGKRDVNVNKNRYKNIVPYDHTRVVLKEVGQNPGDTDYINANYIRIPGGPPLYLLSDKVYISTQGCLPHTVVDFWKMVWQENCRVIVMTTKEIERAKSKCERYWPDLNFERKIGLLLIKNVEEIVVKNDVNEDSYIKRKLVVTNGDSPPRELSHLQFVSWPDLGCPDHPEHVLDFLDAVDDAWEKTPNPKSPIVVHCSAGIGRTGTFIVIDVLLNQIKKRGRSCPIDIPKTVECIRGQRSGMVQTEAQYCFLYKAICCYIQRTCKRRIISSTNSSNSNSSLTLTGLPSAPPVPPRRQNAIPHPAQAYVNENDK